MRVAPGGRPHIRVDKGAPVEDFAAIAADHPVFAVHRPTARGDVPVRVTRWWPRTTVAAVVGVVLVLWRARETGALSKFECYQ